MVRIATGTLQTLLGKRESVRHSTGTRREKSMLSKRALLVVFCFVVFPICPLLYSQANGSFSGTVADKTGSVIAGATVKITSESTGLTRDTKTDGTGHYLVPLLPATNYTIRVEAQGFQTTEQKGLRLQVNEERE